MVICANCGNQNPDEGRFCDNCGAALRTPTDSSASGQPPEPTQPTITSATATGGTQPPSAPPAQTPGYAPPPVVLPQPAAQPRRSNRGLLLGGIGGCAAVALLCGVLTVILALNGSLTLLGGSTATPTPRTATPGTATPGTTPSITPSASPTASPTTTPAASGGLIAYARKDSRTNLEVYVMNADGSNPRNLSNFIGFDDGPVFSPDGKQIAFVSDRPDEGKTHVWLINVDGSGLKQVTKGNADDYNPTWSPDGKQIIFESNGTGNFQLYKINVDGSGLQRLTNHPTANEGRPAWSPDGKQVTFHSDREGGNPAIFRVYIMNADGTNLRLLDTTRGSGQFAAWSPDSKTICFTSYRSGATELWLINADGSNLRRLTYDATDKIDNWLPAWMPDGKTIVYTSNRQDNDEEIWTVKIDGPQSGGKLDESNFKRLTHHPDRDYNPKASPK